MPRIDAHVHAFPERLALAVRNRLDPGGRFTDSPLLDPLGGRVRDAGFDRAWILPYAHRAGVAESLNEWVAAEVTRYPWLVPGASFHPDDDHLPALVRHALIDLRLRVVKVHCAVGAFPPTDPRLRPLWEAAESEGVPIVIHVGQRSPGDTADDEVRQLVPVLTAHPRLRIVLAHTGHPSTASALELLDRHEHLYSDVTPVGARPNAIDPSDLERFAGRILFGSDAPNNATPPADQAAGWATAGLSEHALAMLMGGTAAALIPD